MHTGEKGIVIIYEIVSELNSETSSKFDSMKTWI